MTEKIDQAFNDSVAYYDGWVRKAVPGYDDMFAIARELLPFPPEREIEVLDLGAGTGLFSQFVLESCPRARFTLWDVAEKMLEVARERFSRLPGRFRCVTADYRELSDAEKYDLVISSLSIHHLSDQEKRELFQRVYRALRGGGIFINIDQIRGPNDRLQQMYCDAWLRKVRAAGASEEEVQAGVQRRTAFDREATMSDQLLWLQEAGFRDVDCIYKNYLMGLFYAAK